MVGTILKEECSCNKCNNIENKRTVGNYNRGGQNPILRNEIHHDILQYLQNTICVPLSLVDRFSPRDALNIYTRYTDIIRHYPDNDTTIYDSIITDNFGLQRCNGRMMYYNTIIEGNDFMISLYCTRCSLQILIPLDDELTT